MLLENASHVALIFPASTGMSDGKMSDVIENTLYTRAAMALNPGMASAGAWSADGFVVPPLGALAAVAAAPSTLASASATAVSAPAVASSAPVEAAGAATGTTLTSTSGGSFHPSSSFSFLALINCADSPSFRRGPTSRLRRRRRPSPAPLPPLIEGCRSCPLVAYVPLSHMDAPQAALFFSSRVPLDGLSTFP